MTQQFVFQNSFKQERSCMIIKPSKLRIELIPSLLGLKKTSSVPAPSFGRGLLFCVRFTDRYLQSLETAVFLEHLLELSTLAMHCVAVGASKYMSRWTMGLASHQGFPNPLGRKNNGQILIRVYPY